MMPAAKTRAKSRARQAPGGFGEWVGVAVGVVVFMALFAWLGWYVTGLMGWSHDARMITAGACAGPLIWRCIKTVFLLVAL